MSHPAGFRPAPLTSLSLVLTDESPGAPAFLVHLSIEDDPERDPDSIEEDLPENGEGRADA